jgi:hypothetical protein
LPPGHGWGVLGDGVIHDVLPAILKYLK